MPSGSACRLPPVKRGYALDFTADTAYCTHAAAASINSLDAQTWIFHLYPTTVNKANSRLVRRGGIVEINVGNVDAGLPSGGFRYFRDRATTDTNVYSATGTMTLAEYQIFAATDSDGVAPNIYRGTCFKPMAEITYGATRVTGAGAPVSDAGSALLIGGRDTATTESDCIVPYVWIYNRRLPLAAIEKHRLDPDVRLGGCVLMMAYGTSGHGRQIDRSGYRNDGVPTGAVSVIVPQQKLQQRPRRRIGKAPSGATTFTRNLSDNYAEPVQTFSRISDALRVYTDNYAEPAQSFSRISDALRTCTDNYAQPAQSFARISSALRSIANNIGESDTVSRISDALRLLTSNVGVTDSFARVSDALRSISDSLAYSQAFARVSDANRISTDTVATTDTVARVSDANRFLSSLLGITDSAVRQSDTKRLVSDLLAVAETFARIADAKRVVLDSYAIGTDATTFLLAAGVFTVAIMEHFAQSDTFSRQANAFRIISDNFGVTEAVTALLGSAGVFKAWWAMGSNVLLSDANDSVR